MQRTHFPSTDAVIIGRLVKPDHSDFSSETARDILSTPLIAEDQRHMHELSPNPKTERSHRLTRARWKAIGG